MTHKSDMNLGLKNVWEFVCYDSNGIEKWRESKMFLHTCEMSGSLCDVHSMCIGFGRRPMGPLVAD